MHKMKAGHMIEAQRKKLGFSLRQLEDELRAMGHDVSRRTIGRIESEDFSSVPEKIENVVDFLFQDQKTREQVLRLTESTVSENKTEIAKRRGIRLRMSKASKRFEFELKVHSGVGMSLDKQWEYMEWSKKQEEAGLKFDVHKQFYFKQTYKKPFATLDIYEVSGKTGQGGRIRIGIITAEEGLIFFGETGYDCHRDHGEGKYKIKGVLGTYGSAIDWTDTMKPYGEYCTKKRIQKDVILRLARRDVTQDKYLLRQLVSSADYVQAERTTFDFYRCSLMDAILSLEKNPLTNKAKIGLLNKLRSVESHMSEWQKRPEDLPKLRTELLNQIDTIISKISYSV